MTKHFASEALRPRAIRNSPDIVVILALVTASPAATTLPVSPYAEFMMSVGGSLNGMPPHLDQPRGDK